MDPRAALVSEATVDVVAGPANHDQDGESWTTLESVFHLDLVDELPNLMVYGAEPLPPFQSGVDSADLVHGVILCLEEFTEGQPRTQGWVVMICHKCEGGAPTIIKSASPSGGHSTAPFTTSAKSL